MNKKKRNANRKHRKSVIRRKEKVKVSRAKAKPVEKTK